MQHSTGLLLRERDITALLPALARELCGELLLERCQLPCRLQVDLELRVDDAARVAQPRQQRPVQREHHALTLAVDIPVRQQVHEHDDGLGLLMDDVQQRLGSRRLRTSEEALSCRLAEEIPVFEQVPQHLGEARLARTEEAADPDVGLLARHRQTLAVGLEHPGQRVDDVLCGDVLVDLIRDDLFVGELDLDDLLDRSVDRPAKDIADLHSFSPRVTIVARYP